MRCGCLAKGVQAAQAMFSSMAALSLGRLTSGTIIAETPRRRRAAEKPRRTSAAPRGLFPRGPPAVKLNSWSPDRHNRLATSTSDDSALPLKPRTTSASPARDESDRPVWSVPPGPPRRLFPAGPPHGRRRHISDSGPVGDLHPFSEAGHESARSCEGNEAMFAEMRARRRVERQLRRLFSAKPPTPAAVKPPALQ